MKEITKPRQSNLELLRIFLILTIMANHYVSGSGILQLYDYNNISGNMLFTQIFSSFGHMAINTFIIISSYFMCKSILTWKKVLKLFLEIKFYSLAIYFIFIFAGYTEFSISHFIKVCFNLIYSVNISFTGSFMMFYILIPFLNRIVKNISKKTHGRLCLVLLFCYSIISTFSLKNDTWSYIGWFTTLYLIASYIRFYPNKFMETKKYSLIAFCSSMGLITLSILVIDFIGAPLGFTRYDYMFCNSNKLLSVIAGISIFLFFKNLNIKYSRCINWISSSSFAVFLIHTRGDSMRKFLWQDLLQNTSFFQSPWLPLHAFLSIISIFMICALIDKVRIVLFEKPLFKQLSKYEILNKECFFAKEDTNESKK